MREDVSRYVGWAAELADLLPAGAAVADLGCGIGLPATRELTGHGPRARPPTALPVAPDWPARLRS